MSDIPSEDVREIIEIQELIGVCDDLIEKSASKTRSDAVKDPLRDAQDNLMRASEQLGNVLEATR